MYIQHNTMAAETNRFLGFNERLRWKSTEKLSTGYRVNRAADDAAGLTISEKMRGQIRGLHQASDNIQDGISLIQTAEGALQETHSILQRMRELSVQAANDTYVETDREAIQAEMDQLTEEVDRIAEHTEFNNGIYPLLGGGVSDKLENYLMQRTFTYTATQPCIVDGVSYNIGDSVSATCVFFDYAANGTKGCIYLFGNNTFSYLYDSGLSYADIVDRGLDRLPLEGHREIYSSTLEDWGVDEEGRIYMDWLKYTGKPQKYYMMWHCHAQDDIYHLHTTYDKDDSDVIKLKLQSVNSDTPSSLWIQAGANANQGINISLVDGTAAGLGLTSVSVLSNIAAGNAIQTVDDAISQVSRYRSDFGAQQNRLEHAMAVDDNIAENLQAAESRIRDTDMADEIVGNAKLTIMEQAMQAMLANANRQPEGILALLQG